MHWQCSARLSQYAHGEDSLKWRKTTKTSQKGIDLIKSFEGCWLESYKAVPTEKYYTIGYGHYGFDVSAGMVITQAQADAFLVKDLAKFEASVMSYNSKYHWTQSEFDAMVSFAYNVGNIKQLTNNGTRTKEVIADKMLQYTKSGGKVLNGLVKRRKAEHDLFISEWENEPKNGQIQSDNGIVEYSLAKDGNKQLAPNFKVKEFRCKDGSDKILIDVDFVRDKLQKIRDYFGKPITINSAYRNAVYNKSVGGAKNSYHVKGQAFDIVVKGVTPSDVSKYAQQIGVPGIIQYNTFTHVDSRSGKYYARNNNGKVTKLNSFT